MDNQQAFMTKILELGELFDKKLSDASVKLYWRSLNEFTDEQVQAALDLALINSKFMPKPVEIRELIQGDPKSNAIEEWGRLMKFMRRVGRFGEDKLPPHVADAVRQLGGWEYLCTLNHRDLEFKSKDFINLYEGKLERGEAKPALANNSRLIENREGEL